MKKPIIKIFDKVIVLLLVLFGVFAGCDKSVPEYGMPVPEYGVIVPMYGSPTNVIINDDTNPVGDILEMNEDNIQE